MVGGDSHAQRKMVPARSRAVRLAALVCAVSIGLGVQLALTGGPAEVRADAAARAASHAARLAKSRAPGEDFHNVETISLAELSEMRGGFSVGGLDLDIGANIRTFVDGTLVLESIAQVTSSGLVSQLVNSPADEMGEGVAINFGKGSDVSLKDIAPANINLGGLANEPGIAINDSNGFSAALHRITQNQLLGILISTPDGHNLRSEVNVEVTINNFGRFQQSIRNSLFNSRLLNGVGHVN